MRLLAQTVPTIFKTKYSLFKRHLTYKIPQCDTNLAGFHIFFESVATVQILRLKATMLDWNFNYAFRYLLFKINFHGIAGQYVIVT